jgi:hypothetical protein
MAAGEINGIKVLRVHGIRGGRVGEQGHARCIRQPCPGRGIPVRPFQRARLQRRVAAQRADQVLRVTPLGKDFPGMAEL